MEKKIDRLHVIYCVIICVLVVVGVLLCWILTSKNAISEHAFDNFAFAATIVSIVLALVSIIYTIHSGAGVTNSIGVLKNVEDNISEQLETLQGVEKVIKHSICEEQQKIELSIGGIMKSHFDQLLAPSSSFQQVERFKKEKTPAVIDLQNNPPLGNVFLYCCLLSKTTNKPWPLEMPQKMISLYFLGYIGALKANPAVEFKYHLDKEHNILSQCEFSQTISEIVTIEKLKEVLKKQSEEYPVFVDVIARVESFFQYNQSEK